MARRGKRKQRATAGDRQPEQSTPDVELAAAEAEPAEAASTDVAAKPAEVASTDVAAKPTEVASTDVAAEPAQSTSPPDRSAVEPAASARGAGLTAFWHHLHPPRVRRRSITFGATLGLGLATVSALALAVVSGILLMFYYVPAVDRAHASVQDLMAVVPAGRLMRNLHRWSAHATVLLSTLHMLRTLLWGAYRGSHARVWLVGVGLLLAVVATSFSGYLLPWDQESYWTVTVGTSLAGYVPGLGQGLSQFLMGGSEVAQPTLTRFHMLHVMLLPVLTALLLLLHLFRLRRAGGLTAPTRSADSREELIPVAPHLTARELALALGITLGLLLLAMFVQAWLGPAPDLLRPDNPPKAPWFLIGFQEMVGYSASVGGFFFPALLLLALALGPWLDGGARGDGRFLPGRGPRVAALAMALAACGASVVAVLWWGDSRQGTASWVNPTTISVLVVVGTTLFIWGLSRSRQVAYQLLVLGLLLTLAVFTVVGWYFRGPDWSLVYHPGPGSSRIEARP